MFHIPLPPLWPLYIYIYIAYLNSPTSLCSFLLGLVIGYWLPCFPKYALLTFLVSTPLLPLSLVAILTPEN